MGAGPALLEAVVDPEQSVALWVADPNPRAQAFYRKHGFVADRAAQVEDGMREIPHGPRLAAQSVIQVVGGLPPGAVAWMRLSGGPRGWRRSRSSRVQQAWPSLRLCRY
jgi:hypothetical protein